MSFEFAKTLKRNLGMPLAIEASIVFDYLSSSIVDCILLCFNSIDDCLRIFPQHSIANICQASRALDLAI